MFRELKEDVAYDLSELGELAGCVRSSAEELRHRILAWLRAVYEASPAEAGVALPEVGDGWVRFSGFAGRVECPGGVVEVVPKVGWDGVLRMLDDVVSVFRNLPTYLRASSPLGVAASAVALGWGNTLAVEYSLAVLELSWKFLSTFRPLSLERLLVTAGGVVGRPNVAETVRLMMRGVPMGVFSRVRAVEDIGAAAVFRALNEAVKRDLEALVQNFEGFMNVETSSVGVLAEELRRLISAHKEVLQRLSEARGVSITRELLMRVRELGRSNPVIVAGVDLYIAYRAYRHLLKRGGEGRLHLISTHKLYELWILAKVLQRLGATQLVGRLSLKNGGKFVNDVEVEYDVMYGSVLRRLAGGAHIRPDIVVKLPGGRTFVIDAKYKEEVSEEDLGRLLIYAVELSQPDLSGAMAYLGDSKVWKSRGRRVGLCKADPRTGYVDFCCLIGFC
ncbi:MAG: hypothetical protein RXQ02_06665 [Thermoproteus sp.]